MAVSPGTIVCLYISALAFFGKGCVDKHKKDSYQQTTTPATLASCIIYILKRVVVTTGKSNTIWMLTFGWVEIIFPSWLSHRTSMEATVSRWLLRLRLVSRASIPGVLCTALQRISSGMPMPQTVTCLHATIGGPRLADFVREEPFRPVSGEGSLYLQIVPVFQTAPLIKVLRERPIIPRKELETTPR